MLMDPLPTVNKVCSILAQQEREMVIEDLKVLATATNLALVPTRKGSPGRECFTLVSVILGYTEGFSLERELSHLSKTWLLERELSRLGEKWHSEAVEAIRSSLEREYPRLSERMRIDPKVGGGVGGTCKVTNDQTQHSPSYVANFGSSYVASFGSNDVANFGSSYVANFGSSYVANLGSSYVEILWLKLCSDTLAHVMLQTLAQVNRLVKDAWFDA
ncbi:hypothetical protein Lal_00013466 [Lupinus albus]|nr:hypothetical protein Lal_00013466 [Lupinus albus]